MLVLAFRNLDTDGSGMIDYTEFIAATLETQSYLKQDQSCKRVAQTRSSNTMSSPALPALLREEVVAMRPENLVLTARPKKCFHAKPRQMLSLWQGLPLTIPPRALNKQRFKAELWQTCPCLLLPLLRSVSDKRAQKEAVRRLDRKTL